LVAVSTIGAAWKEVGPGVLRYRCAAFDLNVGATLASASDAFGGRHDMDFSQLASSTVSLIAAYLSRLVQGTGSAGSGDPAAGLLELVEKELGGDELGAVALQRLRERPSDHDVRSIVERTLAGALRRNPQLAGALEEHVRQAAPGITAAPTNTSVGRDLHISAARRAQVALGSITNASHFRFQLVGGGGALVAAILILVLVVRPVSQGQPPFSNLPFFSTPTSVSGPIARQGQLTLREQDGVGLEAGVAASWSGFFPSSVGDVEYLGGQLYSTGTGAFMAPIDGQASPDSCTSALRGRRDEREDLFGLTKGSWICVATRNGRLAAVQIVEMPTVRFSPDARLVLAYVVWQLPAPQ
jgi:hypothetical protein